MSTPVGPIRVTVGSQDDVNLAGRADGHTLQYDAASGLYVHVPPVDSVDGRTGAVTLGDLYAPASLATTVTALDADLDTHIASTLNPHGVTAAQVGAYPTATVDTLLAGKADAAHNHDATYAPIAHAHDDRYYTEAESDALYAALAGRAGGQTISGGTGAGETLTLRGTSDATPGTVYLNGATAHVDTAGNVRVGGYNVADLAAKTFASGRNGSNIVDMYAADATAGGRPILLFSRSRGTTAAPAAVQDGDWLGTFQANAWQGTGFAESARIMFQVDGPVTSGQRAPGKIVLMTAPSGGSTTARITIGAAGQVEISGVRDAVDDAAAAALSPAVPVNGLYRTGSTLKIRVS